MYPSVTTVLRPWLNFDGAGNRLQDGAWRGGVVHKYCTAYAEFGYAQKPLDEHRGYVDSFKTWWDLWGQDCLSIEEEYIDAELGYRGHPDLVAILRGGMIVVVDIKTSAAPQKAWSLQLAAYCHMVRKRFPHLNKGCSLMLDKGGGVPTLRWYEESSRDFAAFIACLTAWKYLT